MSVYVRTNVASLEAQRHLSNTQMEQSKTFQRLSSGYRINGAADDAAGLGITESMNAQIRSYAVAERNANDGISMAETADGAAGQMSGILTRLRELAVQSANGSLQAADRTNLNTEFVALRGEIDRISTVTKFNGQSLLSGAAANVNFQVGIGTSASDTVAISFGGVTTTTLGINTSTVDSAVNATGSITALDAAIGTLSTTREGFGSAINRLTSTVSNLQSMRTNLSAAHSRIKDVDVADETAALARSQVLSQAGVAVLSQANQAPQLAMSLLRG
ncbi:MAG: flagellin [Polyangiaceae bacterium]